MIASYGDRGGQGGPSSAAPAAVRSATSRGRPAHTYLQPWRINAEHVEVVDSSAGRVDRMQRSTHTCSGSETAQQPQASLGTASPLERMDRRRPSLYSIHKLPAIINNGLIAVAWYLKRRAIRACSGAICNWVGEPRVSFAMR